VGGVDCFLDVCDYTSAVMSEPIYQKLEVVGSSVTSIEDAIQTAVTRTAATSKGLRWFEVVEVRGNIDNGKVAHWQVTLKIGMNPDKS
jgi:dodecin